MVVNLVHHKTGRIHAPSFDKRRLQKWALEYERKHGLHCHVREENADWWKRRQHAVTRAWRAADNGKSFEAALAADGLVLAATRRGRGFLIIDERGDIRRLAGQLDTPEKGKAKTAAINARLADLDRSALPDADRIAATRLKAQEAQKGQPKQAGKQPPKARQAFGEVARDLDGEKRREAGGKKTRQARQEFEQAVRDTEKEERSQAVQQSKEARQEFKQAARDIEGEKKARIDEWASHRRAATQSRQFDQVTGSWSAARPGGSAGKTGGLRPITDPASSASRVGYNKLPNARRAVACSTKSCRPRTTTPRRKHSSASWPISSAAAPRPWAR